jgi:hypothetical protein
MYAPDATAHVAREHEYLFRGMRVAVNRAVLYAKVVMEE